MKRSFKKFEEKLESIGLKKKIEGLTAKTHVSLRELYEGPNRAPSITAARRTVYKWLLGEGKGLNEIARIFDRYPSGVSDLLSDRKARR